ncbi:MAG: HINT domain-containing protein [Myxococcales bacterium]|nr:HINT domain-containing protein [Myxococcales bacterium]
MIDAEIEYADGPTDTLTGTPNHPFWVGAVRGYVPLGDLQVGTELHVQGGGEAILVSKTWRQGDFEVFDFEVEGLHNFHVRGKGSDAAGVLVHNSTPARVSAQQRADELHGVLDPRAQSSRTTGVTETEEGYRLVSSSERRLAPAQRDALKPGELEAIGDGHAEVTGWEDGIRQGLTPTGTATSRPHCPNCGAHMDATDVQPLSPMRE